MILRPCPPAPTTLTSLLGGSRRSSWLCPARGQPDTTQGKLNTILRWKAPTPVTAGDVEVCSDWPKVLAVSLHAFVSPKVKWRHSAPNPPITAEG